MVLTSRSIEFVTIDISAPGMQEMRSFMRMNGRKREGQRNVLPPQIFNGEEYRGDFEGFDIANEDDDLEEFLGIPRKNPKVEPVKTGAVAIEVEKINPGKLAKDGVDNNKVSIEIEDTEEKAATLDKDVRNSTSCSKIYVEVQKEPNQTHENQNISKLEQETTENLENFIEDKTLTSLDMFQNKGHIEDNDNHAINDECQSQSEASESQEGKFIDWKKSLEEEALQNATNKVSEKTDGLDVHVREDVMIVDTHKNIDEVDDSSDESSDEDTAVEYMPDGELVRKKSRGFKQLNNCKRFWKASLMVQ